MASSSKETKYKNTCYWCGQPATTREHVPPRSFFPDSYECNGEVVKAKWERLITVPSCTQHNNSKSDLDDYLRMHIVPFAKSDNIYAATLNQGKIFRAWCRTPALLQIKSFDGDILTFDVDDEKLGYALDAIARALYFHEFKTAFEGKCYTFWTHYSETSVLHGANTEVLHAIARERPQWNTPLKGEYPEIFQYQFSPTDQWGSTSLVVTFYESISAVVVLADEAHQNDRDRLNAIDAALACSIDPRPFYLGPQGYSTRTNTDHETTD